MISHDKYKPTSIEFMEFIPATWKLGRLKDISNMNEKSLTDKISKYYQFKYVDISNVNQNGLIHEPETITFSEAPSRARRIVREKDIIISTVRTYLKAIAYFDFNPKDYIASTGFAVLSPNKKIDSKFLAFYSQSELFVDSVIRFSTGVSYPAINSTTLSCLSVHLPSKKEQTAIAQYLDAKTQAIDKKINLLTKKAETYKELRKSIINDAICKGLDKNVKLKESGIDWIGKIPEHWKIARVKDYTYLKARIGWQGLRSDEFIENTNWYCVTGTDFRNGSIDWANCYCVEKDRFDQDKKIQLKPNDLLITKDGTIGKIALIKELPKQATLNSGVFVTRPLKNKYYNHFMFWLLNSDVFTRFIDYNKNGTTILHLYQNVFEIFFYCLPPKSEQTAIANYLDEKTQKIDAIVSNIAKQIDTLKELRKTLINDVVTGKIKVVA